jgi:hypothetical protein
MKLVFLGIAGFLGVFWLATAKSTSVKKKNSGIGGAFRGTNGVVAFPTGQVASSVASLGSSIFGGAGTHNPVDASIKSPGAMGTPLSNDPMKTAVVSLDDKSSSSSGTPNIVTSLDGPGPSNVNVPSAQTVSTQIDASAVNAGIDTVAPTDSAVTYADFGG